MILYVCAMCGRWQDVSFAQVFQQVLAPLAKFAAEKSGTPYEEPMQGHPCPAGHGLMTLVGSNDRLFVRISKKEESRT